VLRRINISMLINTSGGTPQFGGLTSRGSVKVHGWEGENAARRGIVLLLLYFVVMVKTNKVREGWIGWRSEGVERTGSV